MAQHCRKHVYPFVHTCHPRQMSAGQGIPGPCLQLNAIFFKQHKGELLYALPVDIRPGGMRQLAHFITQRNEVRERTRIVARPDMSGFCVFHDRCIRELSDVCSN